jgi:hypothetical protein
MVCSAKQDLLKLTSRASGRHSSSGSKHLPQRSRSEIPTPTPNDSPSNVDRATLAKVEAPCWPLEYTQFRPRYKLIARQGRDLALALDSRTQATVVLQRGDPGWDQLDQAVQCLYIAPSADESSACTLLATHHTLLTSFFKLLPGAKPSYTALNPQRGLLRYDLQHAGTKIEQDPGAEYHVALAISQFMTMTQSQVGPGWVVQCWSAGPILVSLGQIT